MAKGLACLKCSFISEVRKRNQIAENHEELGSSRLWQGFSSPSLGFNFWHRCPFWGSLQGGIGKSIPPVLAANLPFFPDLDEFILKIRSTNLNMDYFSI